MKMETLQNQVINNVSDFINYFSLWLADDK